MILSMQTMLRKTLTSNGASIPAPNPISVPGGCPSGTLIAFLYSDLRTKSAVCLNRYSLTSYHSIPRTPWNKKTSKRERVLKRKSFKNSIQQSNSPTRENISKHNSLLYSSIYFLLNHIYILHGCCFVGRCWTCWILGFQPSNRINPTKNVKKVVCWTCWTVSNDILQEVNLCN